MGILRSASLPEAIEANEENIAEAYTALYSGYGEADFYGGEDVIWWQTRVPSPFINNATYARFETEEADDRLDAIIAEAQSRRVPMRWWLGPGTRPADLAERLEKRGYARKQPTGMAIDLSKMEAPRESQELRVARVSNATQLSDWTSVLAAGFDIMPEATALFGRAIKAVGLDSPAWSLWVAYLDGEPVAASCSYQGSKVVGLYNVATLPQARGKGAGSAVSYAPLDAARKAGYAVGTLQASSLGLGVYRRLGFEEICPFNLMIAPPVSE